MLAQQKAANLQAQLHTKDIQMYFMLLNNESEPGTNEKNLLRPP